ncbi:MAG: terminase family protein [Mycobacterium sp.]|uniref:phage terminase large subunit family protein n=1 Tax=Mycobacterium sp. TaxID=1785 RepID=UPI003CC63DCC
MQAETARMERLIAAKAPPRPRPWHQAARPEQLPPAGDWNIWLVCGGRGCVAAGTRVYMPDTDTHEPIEALAEAGRPVAVLALTPGGPSPVRTAGAPFLKGYAELFEVTCADGSRVTVTDQHRFLTPRGWLRLADVRVGQLLAAGAPEPQVAASGDLCESRGGVRRGSTLADTSRPSRLRSGMRERLGGTANESHLSAEPSSLSHVDDIRWACVEHVSPAGYGAFYDMHVPGWNNYAAEGLWHHNSGKTRLGSEWIAEQAARNAGTSWAIVGPTWRAVQTVCIQGDSGVERVFLPGEFDSINLSNLEVRLTNGSRILGFPAERPDRLRGANLSGAWIDELCTMPKVWDLFYEALMPALRIGENPRVLITTTPRPIPLLKELLGRDDGSVAVVRTKMSDNAANLSKRALADLTARHAGTRIGRQELDGELIEDLDGALWNRRSLEDTRVLKVADVPPLARVVVGVDPAVTSGEKADDTGIVVAGRSHDGHLYVLEDCTLKGTPHQCMSRAVSAYHRWHADRIVGEVNNGGDYIGTVLRSVDSNVAYSTVHATRGKIVRAEPISALWEQGRGHIVGMLPTLEDQMCAYTADTQESPDNLDAMVWTATELNVGASAMIYLSAISTMCGECGMLNRRKATVCRGCGAGLDAAA